MAGFMEGFGQAFSRSFEAGVERNEQRKDDAFKLMYADYLDRRKEQKAMDKDVSWAKNTASTLGLPSEAWPKLYEWKQSGMGEDDIRATALNGIWKTSTPQADQTSNIAAPDQAQAAQQASQAAADPRLAQEQFPTPVDQQMSASGMAPAPAATQAPTQVPAPQAQPTGNPMANLPTMKNGLLGALSGVFNKNPNAQFERDRQAGMKRISGITGASQEQIDATMSGTPSTPIPSGGVTFTPNPIRNKVSDLGDAYVNYERAKAAFDADRSEKNKMALSQASIDKKALEDEANFKARASAKAQGIGGMGLTPSEVAVIVRPDGTKESATVIRTEDGRLVLEDGTDVEQAGIQVRPYNKMQTDIIKKLITTRPEGVKEFQQTSNELAPMLSAGASMMARAEKNPLVLKGGVSYLASLATDAARELEGARDLLLNSKGGYTEADVDNFMAQQAQRVSSMVPENVRQLAQDAVAYEADRLRFTLAAAKAQGQTAKSMSDMDFKNEYKKTEAGTIDALRQQIAGGVNGLVTSLNAQAVGIRNWNNSVRNFEDTQKVPSGIQPFEVDLEKMVGENAAADATGNVGRGWNLYKEFYKDADKKVENANTNVDEKRSAETRKGLEAKDAETAKNKEAAVKEAWAKATPEQALKDARDFIKRFPKQREKVIQRLIENNVITEEQAGGL